jgi:glycerophosphoryl diester phosphodiesterase
MAAERRVSDFLRIAHRGASGECPENTMAAFRRAIEQSAGMIECDLQLTADGHVVVCHDWTVDRTTGARGRVSELTLDEIRSLDAGSWRGDRFAGERVPTLEELLELALPRTQLNLELKCRDGAEAAHRLAMAVLAAVSRRDGLDAVIFSSFDAETLEAVRDVSPYAQIGILWSVPPFDLAWEVARDLGAIALHPAAESVTPEIVDLAHENGLAVYVWTVNELDHMVDLVRMGVDGLFSDVPGRMLEARARLLGAGRGLS